MKKRKRMPYIFVGLLIAIIIFIGGIRYGQNIEKTNKNISYLLSVTPTKAVTPSQIPTISYSLYTHKGCSISFLKPSYIKKIKETSASAVLESNNQERLEFNCSIDKKAFSNIDQKNATNSVKLNNKEFIGIKNQSEKTGVTDLVILSPDKKMKLTIKSNTNLFSIIEQTLNFLP